MEENQSRPRCKTKIKREEELRIKVTDEEWKQMFRFKLYVVRVKLKYCKLFIFTEFF